MELELETDSVAVRLSRNHSGQAMVSAPAAAPVAAAPVAAPAAAPTPAAAPAMAETKSDADLSNHPGAVKSPMVGTAYNHLNLLHLPLFLLVIL